MTLSFHPVIASSRLAHAHCISRLDLHPAVHPTLPTRAYKISRTGREICRARGRASAAGPRARQPRERPLFIYREGSNLARLRPKVDFRCRDRKTAQSREVVRSAQARDAPRSLSASDVKDEDEEQDHNTPGDLSIHPLPRPLASAWGSRARLSTLSCCCCYFAKLPPQGGREKN